MNKQEVYALLQAKQLHFEITEHPAVYTMTELATCPVPIRMRTRKASLFVMIKSSAIIYLLSKEISV